MKKHVLAIFALFLLFFTLTNYQVQAASPEDIIINEIGAYEATDYEWVEIYNRGQQSVDLTGWKFVEDFSASKPNGTSHALNFSGTATLATGQYAVISQNNIKFKEKYPNFTGLLIDSSWSSLNESGEKIGLKDSSENFAELFIYIEAKNYSLERKNSNLNDYASANWQEHQNGNTVGTQNSNSTSQNTTTQQTSQETTQQTNSESTITNTQTPNSITANAGENIIALTSQEITFDASKSEGDILFYEWNFGDGQTAKGKIVKHKYAFPGRYIGALSISDGNISAQSQITATIYPAGVYINEFIPSPAGSDENEWIEIYNPNNFPVNISDWTIGDNSKKSFSFPPNTFIAQQSYLVIPRAITKIALNNDADTLKFYYPENILIEEIKYEKAKEGYSASKKQNMGFVWTKNPTPSAPNIISGENITPHPSEAAQSANFLLLPKDEGQKPTVAIPEQGEARDITVSNQKFMVTTSGFIIKNLVNTAEAHHVEEEAVDKNNYDSQSVKSETNNDPPIETDSSSKSDLSANISDAFQNKNTLLKIMLILATLSIFALMWRVIKK